MKRDYLAIQLSVKSERDSAAQDPRHSAEQDEPVHRDPHVLVVPWKKTSSKRPREIILPASTSSHPDPRPIRAETRAKLVTAIAKGRHWLDALMAGTVTNVEQIAAREKCSIRQVNRTITLAFIAPTLVQAAVDGRLPRGIGVATVRDFPLNGPANTRDLAWPHKISGFKAGRRRDQNFSGRRLSPNFHSPPARDQISKIVCRTSRANAGFLAKSL